MPIGRLIAAFATLVAAVCAGPNSKARPEPKILSIYPAGGQRGTTFEVLLRGSDLAGAQHVIFDGSAVAARILGVDAEPPVPGETSKKDLVKLRVTLAPDAAPGRYDFRVVTPLGVSGKIPFQVTIEPVWHETQTAEPLRQFPVVINGRIHKPGQTDSYWIEAAAGETLTFEATSFTDSFDPSVSLYEASGSWFDPHRLNQVASNDEPLYFPGLSTDARLVQRFERAGKYCVRVAGFSGQGGPDCVYQLRIVRGQTAVPSLHPPLKADWTERAFTRHLANHHMEELARRSAGSPAGKTASEPASIPVMTAAGKNAGLAAVRIPVMIEGRIDDPGIAHLIRLNIEKPQALAIEVETPEATLPRFNPVVRLMEPGGREIAGDVYTKRNNNGLYMMKMIEAKTIVSLQAPGEYTIQIRDITSDGSGPDFLYRVLVRPQIPHVGSVEVVEDHINLEAGSSKPLTVLIDREEGFSGYVTVEVEGLPAGVTAVAALENPLDQPPLPNGGKLERYVAKQQRTAMMLVASPDSAPTETPARARVVARLLSEGHLSDPIAIKEIPLMVVSGAGQGRQ